MPKRTEILFRIGNWYIDITNISEYLTGYPVAYKGIRYG